MDEIFLGGTCGNNRWREEKVVPALLRAGVPEEAVFNPNLGPGEWDNEAQKREDDAKRHASIVVFYIGDPEDGTNYSLYSVVEATMALFESENRLLVVLDDSKADDHTAKALEKILADWRRRFPNAWIETDLNALTSQIVKRYKLVQNYR